MWPVFCLRFPKEWHNFINKTARSNASVLWLGSGISLLMYCCTIGPGNFLITKHVRQKFIYRSPYKQPHGPSMYTLSMVGSTDLDLVKDRVELGGGVELDVAGLVGVHALLTDNG